MAMFLRSSRLAAAKRYIRLRQFSVVVLKFAAVDPRVEVPRQIASDFAALRRNFRYFR